MRMYPPLTAPNGSSTALISASTTDARIAVPLYRFVTGRSIAPSTDAHDHEGATKQLGLEGDADTGSLTLQRSSMGDRKSTRLNSSHGYISYAVFCLKKKKYNQRSTSLISHHTRQIEEL